MTTKDELIGLNLQRMRRGRSQTEIANEMKKRGHRWTQPTVVAVEKGERPLRLAEADDLVEIFGNQGFSALWSFLLSTPQLRVEEIANPARLALTRIYMALGDAPADLRRAAQDLTERLSLANADTSDLVTQLHELAEECEAAESVWEARSLALVGAFNRLQAEVAERVRRGEHQTAP